MRQSRIVKSTSLVFLGVGVLLLTVGSVRADEKLLHELKARLDRLEKQNEDLRRQLLDADKVAPYKAAKSEEKEEKEKVNKLIDTYLTDRETKKKQEDEKKAKQKEEEGFEVGKHLDAKAQWKNSQLWFETEDRAFRLRIGGRLQTDGVWVHTPKRVMAPLADQGIGEFDDAINFRRARLEMEGTFWEVFDFKVEYDFVNTIRIAPAGGRVDPTGGQIVATTGTSADRNAVINTPVPTDLWVQWSHLPVIGNVRIGNQKSLISMEHLCSSRYLNYLERSLAFDAFVENGNNGFTPGIAVYRNVLDDNLFLGGGIFWPNFRDIFGWDVGDGERQYNARVAGTPIYEDNGRYVLHLGLGYLHSTADDNVIRFRARTMVRNGPAVLHNVIAQIQGNLHSYNLLVPEFLVNCGPWTLSAEGYAAWVDQPPGAAFSAVGLQTRSRDIPGGGRGQLFYSGGYVQMGYFLTGESRGYDRVFKCETRQPTIENAFLVDGEKGVICGRGAWEVLARYQYLNLDSEGVNGGEIHDMTLGVNWFLNPNSKIQVNYSLAYRDATQYAGGGIAAAGDSIRDGLIQGLGTRFAFDF